MDYKYPYTSFLITVKVCKVVLHTSHIEDLKLGVQETSFRKNLKMAKTPYLQHYGLRAKTFFEKANMYANASFVFHCKVCKVVLINSHIEDLLWCVQETLFR